MDKYTVRQCKDGRWRVVTPNGATITAAAYLTRTAAQIDADNKNRICGKEGQDMKIGKRFRGTPQWGEVEFRSDHGYSTISQKVSFNYAGKFYTGTFLRFYYRGRPQGERVEYAFDVVRDQTGRESKALASAMLEQTQWLSTFKRNVAEHAAAL